MVTARRDSSSVDAPPPPAKLRPVLRFSKLPGRALQQVRSVLDDDDEFRRRVAKGATEADLGRASWLFLERPDGWTDEFDLLVAAAAEEHEGDEAARREQMAERRLVQVESTLDALREEHAQAVHAADEAEAVLAEERAARLRLDATVAELTARLAELGDERATAVRHLKRTEALATSRLDELRAAQERVAELEAERDARPEPASSTEVPVAPAPEQQLDPAPGVPAVPSAWDGVDPAGVAEAVARAARASAELGEALAAAAGLLAAPEASRGTTPRPDPAVAPAASAPPASRPPRRSPIRLSGGVVDGTAEGVEQLLCTPHVVAIVDGYNVSMEGWPGLDRHLQRSSLTAALGALRNRSGATVHVVFDGDDDGRRPSVGVPLPVRVHFSRVDVEADDVILAMVAEIPTDVPVVVVSSDRRVAEGARRLGANVVRSSALLALLRR